MILKDTFKLITDIVGKDLVVFNIFLEEIFKFWLHYQVFNFKAIFILVPLPNYNFAKKQDGKKDLIEFIGSYNFKVIIILLIEPVAI